MTVALLLEREFRTSLLWLDALRACLPDEEVVLVDEVTDRNAVDIAIVRGVDPGNLHEFPNLKFIHCLWAGVDKLLDDPTVPSGLPLARTVDPAMADQMAASCLAHVLDICLHHHEYRAQQMRGEWVPLHAPPLHSQTVAILGFGTLGRRCAEYLRFVGANIIEVRSTTANLFEAISPANVVVNLLPLTDQTAGRLNAELFSVLQRGAALVNLGRGAHLVEADLISALDSGQLSRAVLDVFEREPLPIGHPFWAHPSITITPHVAAETDPSTAAPIIAANIRAFQSGNAGGVTGLVDRARGY